MRKLILPLILFLLILAFGVSASWVTPGNAGLQDSEYYYIGYALNYPNPLTNVTNSSYSTCSIGDSTFEPLLYDFTQDYFIEIITGSGNTLKMYDRTCSLLTTFSLPETLNKGGIYIDNPDQDAAVDIIVGADRGLYLIEWNDITNQFQVSRNITNTSITALGQIACPILSGYCLGFSASAANTYLINLTNYRITRVDDRTYAASTTYSQLNSISQYRAFPTAYNPLTYRLPVCLASGADQVICDIYNQYGTKYGSYVTYNYGTLAADNLFDSNAYYAQLGANLRFFVSHKSKYDSTSDYFDGNFITGISDYLPTYYEIYTKADATYNENHFASKIHSNWAVGDINKDGSNEACYIHPVDMNIATTFNATYFTCVNEFYTQIIDIDVTGEMSINDIAIADFDPANAYMCVATYEGIFCPESPYTSMSKFYSTGLYNTTWGRVIVTIDSAGGSPSAIYTDTNSGFIIYSTVIGSTCPSGLCDSYENLFTCPADCYQNTSSTGTTTYANGTAPPGVYVGQGNTYVCASGYIEYGRCALKPANVGCTLNSECLSGTCANSKCTAPTLWQNINNGVTNNVGADSTSLMIFSLIIIIAAVAFILWITRGAMAGVVLACFIGFALTIMFTIFGWMPAYILVVMVMLVVAVVVIMIALSKGGG